MKDAVTGLKGDTYLVFKPKLDEWLRSSMQSLLLWVEEQMTKHLEDDETTSLWHERCDVYNESLYDCISIILSKAKELE